jgi:hypothetical protein
MSDIFYHIKVFGDEYKNKSLELLKEAKELCSEIHLDQLDCSKSFFRVKTEKSFDDIVEIAKKSSFYHFTFIYRKSDCQFIMNGQDYIETGISVINDCVDYFIWVNLETKHLDYFVQKYGLEKS